LEKRNTSFRPKKLEFSFSTVPCVTAAVKLQATFTEAEKMCSEQGLQVTSLSSKKESAKLDEYLNYIGKYTKY
jgi:hypothetical protein